MPKPTKPRLAIPRAHLSRLKNAWDALQTNQEDWPKLVMKVAKELKAARDTFTSAGKGDDTAFGKWLHENEIVMSHQDRAAFIKLGTWPTEAASVLKSTDRRSIRLIWEQELKPLVEPEGESEHEPDPDEEAQTDTKADAQTAALAADYDAVKTEVRKGRVKVTFTVEKPKGEDFTVVMVQVPDALVHLAMRGEGREANRWDNPKAYVKHLATAIVSDMETQLQADAIEGVKVEEKEADALAQQCAALEAGEATVVAFQARPKPN